MMKFFSPAIRISISLVLFTLIILLVADSIFRFSEEGANAMFDGRKILSETLASQASFLIDNGEKEILGELINVTVENNAEVLSIAIHDNKDRISILTGEHEKHWFELAQDKLTLTQAQFPVFVGEKRWGTIQVRFNTGPLCGVLYFLQLPFVKLLLFVGFFGFLVYFWFINKTLQFLDPSALIPERVKTALDSLNEGVMFVDLKGCIVLANSTFEIMFGQSATSLLGHNVSQLNWKIPEPEQADFQFPWIDSIKNGQKKYGAYLVLIDDVGKEISFNVNSSPVYGDKGQLRGAIVSFSDVTELEQANKQLIMTMEELDGAHKKVLQKNKELENLATRDSLTGCLNRRGFFEIFEAEYANAVNDKTELCCIMGDIDLLKNINDSYGHDVGDVAIKSVAKILNSALRTNDIICRYDGGEFCILLIGMNINQAINIAERMRLTVKFEAGSAIREPSDIKITCSFGISSIKSSHSTSNPEELISQADKALYASKKNGRNLVSCYSPIEIAKAN